MKHIYDHKIQSIKILDEWDKIRISETNLDESQIDALKNILTKNICLVQGPPATGKLYLGSVAVKTLIENNVTNKPILTILYIFIM